MIAEIFIALLITSLAGSCLTAVILLVRPFTKKVFGYSWHYYIWLAVLFAMLLPVRFNLPQAADTVPLVSPVIQSEQPVQTEQVQNTNVAAPAPQANPETNLLQTGANFIKSVVDNRMNIIASIWLAGAMILLLISLIGYVRLITKMRKTSVPVPCPELAKFTKRNVAVRVWENTSSPFMAGIFRPTLVLPARELTEEQLNNILRHEMTHLKRCDILYKWLTVFVNCLHWFNPAIWVVAKQINAECEISCDMAVTRNLSRDEEMSYIDTLLFLLPMGKTKQIPFTTQMASSKKILKRRFLMMKTKKATSKFVSVLSVLIALAMLSTTVFASGVLSGLTEEDYTIEITNNGEVIELANKPFIENGEVYVPLRELFEKAGYHEGNSYIHWNNGTIDIAILNYPGDNGLYRLEIGNAMLFLRHFQGDNLYGTVLDDKASIMSVDVAYGNTPILVGSTTYLPLRTMNYILYGFLGKRNSDNSLRELTYTIYDRAGNNITDKFNAEKESREEFDLMKTPGTTTDLFFNAFSNANFEKMKTYCTQSCIDNFFGDGYCFGMAKAELTDINIDPLEYAKSSNDFNVLVTVNMIPHEQSVFDSNNPSTSFYVILQRQPNGRYLIDEFATGL